MPLFSMGWFWLCLLVIFAALRLPGAQRHRVVELGGTRRPAMVVGRGRRCRVHAGWLSMAAFLTLPLLIVAYRLLLDAVVMLAWSLALFAAATVMLLLLNQKYARQHRLRRSAGGVGVC